MAPSTGNRSLIIGLSRFSGRITRRGKVFLLKFFWLKGEGRKKKSRQPSARCVVFLTKAATNGPRQREAARGRKTQANPSTEQSPTNRFMRKNASFDTLGYLAHGGER